MLCTRKLKRTRLTLHPDRLMQHLRLCDDRWIQSGFTPRYFQRQLRVVHDTSIATVATQVVVRTHEDTIHRTRLHTQCTKHALRVVNRKPVDSKALANRALLFVDVNAVNRTCRRALLAADTCRQIEAMEAAIPRLHLERHLRVFVDFSECATTVRLEHRSQSHIHALQNGDDGQPDISEPREHGNHPRLRLCLVTSLRILSAGQRPLDYRPAPWTRNRVRAHPGIGKLPATVFTSRFAQNRRHSERTRGDKTTPFVSMANPINEPSWSLRLHHRPGKGRPPVASAKMVL